MIKIFVSYSWDSEEHKANVRAFTNELRNQGLHAEMDDSLKQNETAIDFYKMMHKWITDSDKVIIVLSSGYKRKANSFVSGVGNEYSKIIKEINNYPKKYILVSFEGISDDITPLELQGREIIDLSPAQRNRFFKTLLRKLFDIHEFKFDEVSEKELNLPIHSIPRFLDDKVVDNENNTNNIKQRVEQPLPIAENKNFEKKKRNSKTYLLALFIIAFLAAVFAYIQYKNHSQDGKSDTKGFTQNPSEIKKDSINRGKSIHKPLSDTPFADINSTNKTIKSKLDSGKLKVGTGEILDSLIYVGGASCGKIARGKIFFHDNIGTLRLVEEKKLDKLAADMRNNSNCEILIFWSNHKNGLSEYRFQNSVNSIIEYLIGLGIKRQRISVQKINAK